MNIAFFIRHFTERGTEIAAYDYASYNETILNNKSYIICFSEKKQNSMGFPPERHSYEKFKLRFPIIEIDDIRNMKTVIEEYNLSFFYTQTHGGDDIYEFGNKDIWGDCKTIKHCVFNTRCPESDFYISISEYLNTRFNTNIPVIPYIVDSPRCDDNLRKELNIPEDAIVFGRHGGMGTFDIHMAHEAIREILQMNTNIYFLFMNTQRFHNHPRIIYLDRNIDLIYKVKFINTCDAMIHARSDGETFGLAVAEFSIKNKPVITCRHGDLEHIKILGDKAIVYSSKGELVNIFNSIQSITATRSNWNAYTLYTPEYVMSLFKTLIFDKV